MISEDKDSWNLPKDLVLFLKKGRQFEIDQEQISILKEHKQFKYNKYDLERVIERFKLRKYENLDIGIRKHRFGTGLAGEYYDIKIPVVFLSSRKMKPALLWLPDEKMFGTFSTRANPFKQLHIFVGATWNDIANNPLPYIYPHEAQEISFSMIESVTPFSKFMKVAKEKNELNLVDWWLYNEINDYIHDDNWTIDNDYIIHQFKFLKSLSRKIPFNLDEFIKNRNSSNKKHPWEREEGKITLLHFLESDNKIWYGVKNKVLEFWLEHEKSPDLTISIQSEDSWKEIIDEIGVNITIRWLIEDGKVSITGLDELVTQFEDLLWTSDCLLRDLPHGFFEDFLNIELYLKKIVKST